MAAPLWVMMDFLPVSFGEYGVYAQVFQEPGPEEQEQVRPLRG